MTGQGFRGGEARHRLCWGQLQCSSTLRQAGRRLVSAGLGWHCVGLPGELRGVTPAGAIRMGVPPTPAATHLLQSTPPTRCAPAHRRARPSLPPLQHTFSMVAYVLRA